MLILLGSISSSMMLKALAAKGLFFLAVAYFEPGMQE